MLLTMCSYGPGTGYGILARLLDHQENADFLSGLPVATLLSIFDFPACP